jgi:hypothetical protein
MDDTQDLHHQQQLDEQEQMRYCPAYCDYIALKIKEAMNESHPENIIVGAGSVRWDLGANGEFVSTTKHLFVVDRNRKTYKITVEEM